MEALLDRRPSIRVKGKAEPIAVAALRSSPQSGRAEGERAYELPVIARELELELGAAAVGKAAAGAGGVLLITGEPGIGKSRLAAELGRIAAQRGFSVLTGACQSTGASTSYLPWQDILRALFELDDTAPVDRQIEVLTDRLRKIDAQLVPRLPLLAPAVRAPDSRDTADGCARSRASCGATSGAAHRGPAPPRGERPGPARARGLPLDRRALESTVGGGWRAASTGWVFSSSCSRAPQSASSSRGREDSRTQQSFDSSRSDPTMPRISPAPSCEPRAASSTSSLRPCATRSSGPKATRSSSKSSSPCCWSAGSISRIQRRSHGRLSPTPCTES